MTDGYNHDVFILKIENSQMFNNSECYKDYMGITQASLIRKVIFGMAIMLFLFHGLMLNQFNLPRVNLDRYFDRQLVNIFFP